MNATIVADLNERLGDDEWRDIAAGVAWQVMDRAHCGLRNQEVTEMLARADKQLDGKVGPEGEPQRIWGIWFYPKQINERIAERERQLVARNCLRC